MALPAAALTAVGPHDRTQTRYSILRNYPLLAHLRFFFEFIRMEIRQYIVEDDPKAKPFSRNQRSIVYQPAKQELDKRPFGMQKNLYKTGTEWINHSIAPAAVSDHDFRIAISGPLPPAALCRAGARPAGADDRAEALAGGQARPRWPCCVQ